MSRVPQAFVDDLLNRLDIVDVVDSRVKLKRTGKNYSACCPFHNEKSPSFTVSPDKQFYYCFGCGASGDSLRFIMEFDRQSFMEALESTAKTLGLTIPRDENPRAAKREGSGLYTILDTANRHYQTQLRTHAERKIAVNYLKQRGLTGEICMLFGLGYAPPGWDNLLQALGTDEHQRKLLVDSGLLVINDEENKRYDRFRQRIMFPILDVRGRTIGFGGRVLGTETSLGPDGKKTKLGGPKYLNSPETEVFHKGKELYGLYQARQQNRNLTQLLVVEGYMDVIALAQFDITNAVATLGTACGEDHLRLAFKYCGEIIFCFDGDQAGRTAAKRALQNSLSSMEDGRQIKFLFLPEGQDPDSLVRQIGKERFQQQMDQALPLEDFFFRIIGEGINAHSMEGRARISKLATPFLHKLPKGVYRELMFNKLANHTGLSLETLQELIHEPLTALAPTEAAPEQQAPAKLITTLQPRTAALASRPINARIKLNPARMATILLLEYPELLDTPINSHWEIHPLDADDLRLIQLIELIKSHQLRSFHSIIGFWGGLYGVDSQKELTALVVDQFLGSVTRTSPFNAQQELEGAFARLREAASNRRQQDELAQLQAIGFEALTAEQKNRLGELVKARSQNRQKTD